MFSFRHFVSEVEMYLRTWMNLERFKWMTETREVSTDGQWKKPLS
jgi:hypothetical protein